MAKLSNEDKSLFLKHGIIRLRRRVPLKLLQKIQSSIRTELERLNIISQGKISSAKIQNLSVFQQTGRLGQLVKIGRELDQIISTDLIDDMNFLAGKKLKPVQLSPQLLLSLPHRKDWSLDHLNWHLDLEIPYHDVIPGIQAFVLIDDLKVHGGATLAIAGSHKLPYSNKPESESAQKLLRQDEIFRPLFDGAIQNPERYFRPKNMSGIEVFLVEMHGSAGDVYLMDLRVLHSPSINATKNIRMMATNRFVLT
ncbi:hypothetical protein AZI86_05495 [Bdellovibrio bacteriovorus]|uniref:Phytanoyl-CoA dioxygenase n=1 Tax=Bdellovibrio bacteriovorus TaxID=959 RepID=A0A150WPS0_BDEBC|nr:phytanoyl-CoA dioxygenase family protein [Bdellovibrio bacteriovorus]KYG66501.1 hypothetical protein AZI86_05495 [Bdellovibrio bacteriovorus]